MTQQSDDALHQMDQALEELDEVLTDTSGVSTSTVAKQDDQDPEEEKLHDQQATPPSVQDSQAVSGSNPDPESDDDVDSIGNEFGVKYDPKQPLQVENKVQVSTESTPPEADKPQP